MTDRTGFYIKNASDSSISAGQYYQAAEPDAVDFLVLGDHRFGVIAGCRISLSGLQASLIDSTNLAVINGQVVAPINTTAPVYTGSTQNRFDLAVIDSVDQKFKIVEGTAGVDPVFPIPSTTQVVLAVIFVPAGLTTFASSAPYVTDKRIQLPNGVLGTVADASPLLRNVSSSNLPNFEITGDGTMKWANANVTLSRSGPGVLTTDGQLQVASLVSGAITSSGDIATTGKVAGKNIVNQAGLPGSPILGTIHTDSATGVISVYQTAGWAQLPADPVPPATVIQSLLDASSTYLTGWLPLIGQTVTQAQAGRLWTLFPAWQSGGNFVLPDFRNKFLLGGVTPLTTGGNSQVILTVDQMPVHKHLGGGTTDTGGSHTHSVTVSADGFHNHNVGGGGDHGHYVYDPGHAHGGADVYGMGIGTGFVALCWGGNNKIDGPINDSSHTYTVEAAGSTISATTGISVSGGGHGHTSDAAGSHNHSVSLGASAGHTHTFPADVNAGGGQPIDIRPNYVGVNYYIKT